MALRQAAATLLPRLASAALSSQAPAATGYAARGVLQELLGGSQPVPPQRLLALDLPARGALRGQLPFFWHIGQQACNHARWFAGKTSQIHGHRALGIMLAESRAPPRTKQLVCLRRLCSRSRPSQQQRGARSASHHGLRADHHHQAVAGAVQQSHVSVDWCKQGGGSRVQMLPPPPAMLYPGFVLVQGRQAPCSAARATRQAKR
jgi:hypothetical protein